MDKAKLLRSIPSVEAVLKTKELTAVSDGFSREAVLLVVRTAEGEIRKEINSGKFKGNSIKKEVARRTLSVLGNLKKMNLRKAINATGVIIHTNLGRAPLGKEMIAAMLEVSGYSTLEVDIATGKRGSRQSHISGLIKMVTGAEDGMVVNNNAAAVFFALATFARDREVIVSRGELIEIGGSFRIPEIMSLSGAKLVEVGTTNKTYIADYEKAIGENTALLMKIHPSNYRIEGFTREASLEELVSLGKKYSIPVVYDAGSGILLDKVRKLDPREISVREAVGIGVDLVTFSGDKLLGGPQAGLMVGKRELVDSLKNNHLARALRIDKISLAVLERTLRTYLAGDPNAEIPVLRMISEGMGETAKRADKLSRKLKKAIESGGTVGIVDSAGKVGGGAMPAIEIPSKSVSLALKKTSPDELDAKLLAFDTPIFSTIREDALLLNALTLEEDDIDSIVKAVEAAVATF